LEVNVMSVEPVGPSSNEMAHQRTDLACSRTLMAADRSLMAWVRTALSMISFGFTIYKVLEGFQKAGAVLHGVSPRSAGLFLTGLGTLAIVAGTVEYWHVIALILSATGLLLFLGIITRLL
jgi:putative membrane protein